MSASKPQYLHVMFAFLLMLEIVLGAAITVCEFLLVPDETFDVSPIIYYFQMSGWYFWQAFLAIVSLVIVQALKSAIDKHIMLCLNVLILFTVIADFNYLISVATMMG